MAVLIFVRHGKALTNKLGILNRDLEGYPLIEEGITTVTRTAAELKKLKVSKLYASPILGARQTAEIIGKPQRLKPVLDDRLVDRGFGEMVNKPAKDGEWLLDVDWNDTSVETSGAIKKRIFDFIDSVSNENGIIVAVSHEDAIKTAVLNLLGLEYDKFHFGIKITNARMTVLSTNGRRNRLIAVNYPVLPDWLISEIKKEAGAKERHG